MTWIMKTEEEFTDNCECAYKVLNFIDNIETDVRWWFNIAYYNQFDNAYNVLFTSYITEEYKDYVLSIYAIKKDGEWNLRITKKVDGLTK